MSYCKQGQKQYLGVQIKFKASEQKEWFKLVKWRKGEMPLGLLTLYLHFYLYLAHSKKFKLVNWGRMKCLLGWRLWCMCAYWPIRYILLLVPSSRGILNYWSEKICQSKTHPELFFYRYTWKSFSAVIIIKQKLHSRSFLFCLLSAHIWAHLVFQSTCKSVHMNW